MAASNPRDCRPDGAIAPRKDESPSVGAAGSLGLAISENSDFGTEHNEGEWMRQVELTAVATFGPDPCTKAQAAAHEAGHVVVARALGATVTGARIFRSQAGGREIWLGRNHYVPARGFRAATATQDPGLVLRAAMHNLAGFAGELLAGMSHPSSSIDERLLAGRYCEDVATSEGVSKAEIVMRVGRFCEMVLLGNRRAFEVTRGHLFFRHRLTQDEATRMLASVKATHDAHTAKGMHHE